MNDLKLNIIGAGLAGVEAAWAAACGGVNVRLFEMKPLKMSPAHKLEGFAELVCSNSLRSDSPENAAGLLKEEMRSLGSITMEAAEATRVPAGKALAVDRNLFSEYITKKIRSHPNIDVVTEEVVAIIPALRHVMASAKGGSASGGQGERGFALQDESTRAPENESTSELENQRTIIATGPLTSDALAEDIARLTGSEYLYFYDSVAPVIDAGSLDLSKGYKASRYGYGGGDDYWNFPLTEKEYTDFLADLTGAEKVVPREFEKPVYFEGCLPIEVMADRGPQTLRYGPMKPFGLIDPRTGRESHAVIQLRQENLEGTMYNMVGFQTRLKWNEQARIFRKIPGFSAAKFLRYGVIHRNTYMNSPELLDPFLRLKTHPNIFFAGQITGVEGYIESAATGLWLGHYFAKMFQNQEVVPPPKTTALGSLIWHVTNPNHRNFQPMNVNFGLMPIIKEYVPKKERSRCMVERARRDFQIWLGN